MQLRKTILSKSEDLHGILPSILYSPYGQESIIWNDLTRNAVSARKENATKMRKCKSGEYVNDVKT
jgi:hypothetical protein